MIDLKKYKNLLIIIGIIMIITSLNQSPNTEKKEGDWGKIGMGVGLLVVGIGLFFVPGMQPTGATIAGIGGLWAFTGYSLFSGISSFFQKPTISPLVYIGGGILLFILISKWKK